MFIKTFPVGSFQCNCTIIGDEETGEAIVIDPGDEGERILAELKSKKFTVKYLLHTHAHIDHIGATKQMKEETGATIGLHKEDLFLYENLKMQSDLLGMSIDPHVCKIDHYLNHNDIIDWGQKERMEVYHTPGHTPGSLCFLAKNLIQNKDILFTGDTLFMGSIGRTDLWGGDYNQIIDSIKTKLLPLDSEIVVVPGHGPQTTIGQEKMVNPFLT